jgi:exportin-2 (importin alpha re-exporter)
MDALASSLQQSLSPDPATRRTAERQLDTLKSQPGFSQIVLQLAQANDANPAIRQAAALLFKNFVRNGWERVCTDY